MANHLKLSKALFEWDISGNIVIFSNGDGIRLSATEVVRLSSWLNKRPISEQLILNQRRFQMGKKEHLTILKEGLSIYLSTEDTRQLTQWLKSS
ncbi:hypothetical protein [Ktedonospora formicarum]|uniref:Uncharacterized protein n=1 Tax=Ktedonospora formicarum TaxID=2778364 RepID=A0A8J3IBI6_9CHLR|nr:hypothetical protein [Ktedonospora formicarum]GHO50941.1 hypothetical protein KSX_91040 [Ktedonospora formicarum]